MRPPAGRLITLLSLCFCFSGPAVAADPMPVADAHMHYSHDAWDMLPPAQAAEILRKAGLRMAMVSSSSDEGTRMIYEAAPDIVVPVLRPYRRRGELGTWFRDPTVIDHLKARLAKYKYAGIGEFHIYGTAQHLPALSL